MFDIEGRYVVHVEYQDTKAADMGVRMVIYRVFLREHFGPGIPIKQFVVCTGNEPDIGWDIRFPDEIIVPALWTSMSCRWFKPAERVLWHAGWTTLSSRNDYSRPPVTNRGTAG